MNTTARSPTGKGTCETMAKLPPIDGEKSVADWEEFTKRSEASRKNKPKERVYEKFVPRAEKAAAEVKVTRKVKRK